LELVLHDGKDVRAIVTRTRHVPEALKIAIEERDEKCKIRGCDATEHLERHHVEEYAEHHLTARTQLDRRRPASPAFNDRDSGPGRAGGSRRGGPAPLAQDAA
jgi:hypothetical protein